MVVWFFCNLKIPFFRWSGWISCSQNIVVSIEKDRIITYSKSYLCFWYVIGNERERVFSYHSYFYFEVYINLFC
jgi:hypothetical protein